MAELTDNASTPDCIFGTKAGSNNCKSDATMSAGASPLNPVLYVRYKDHVIYKNILQPNPEAIERETVGWLTHQNQDIILIEHDRTIQRHGRFERQKQRNYHFKKLHSGNSTITKKFKMEIKLPTAYC